MAQGKGIARSVEREAYWRGHIEGQSRSGESIRGYCRSYGLSEAGFHFWRRELARRDSQRGAGQASALDKRVGRRVAFAEVRVAPSEQCVAAIEISLPGLRRVWVHPGFDERTLSRVLAVLEQLPC
jgi:hypothetical protein